MSIPSTRLILLCTTALLLVIVSGCGREEPEPEVAAPATIELRMITDDGDSELADALVELLEETHPELTLTYENWSNWPRSYMTGNNPPDLLAVGTGDWVMSTIRDGLVADITDVWEQANLGDSFPRSLQELTMHNGKQYVLPIGYGWSGIYYNRAIFDQYGLTPPETWDELMQIADTLRLNGETPFSLAGRSSWTAALWFDYLNLRLNGPDYHNALLAGEIPYTDDGLRDVLFTWQFLFDQEYFVPNTRSEGGLGSLTAIVRGDKDNPLNRDKAVMTLSNPSEVAELPNVFADELEFFAFPTIDPNIQHGEILFSFGYVVPANAPNRIDALNFLAFAASSEVQNMLSQYSGSDLAFVPAHTSGDVDNLPDSVQAGWQIAQSADAVVQPIMWASPQPMRTAFGAAVESFLRNIGRDTMDIEAILEKLEEERLKQITQGVFDN